MPEDEKDREDRNREDKSWDREVLHKFCPNPSKLIKKYTVLDIINRKKMAKVSRELSHAMLAKRSGYLDTATLVLKTTAKRVESPEAATWTPPRPASALSFQLLFLDETTEPKLCISLAPHSFAREFIRIIQPLM